MDKYVVRTKRAIAPKKQAHIEEKELKQTTILSLKRVVVVEDIKRCTALLTIEDQSVDVLVEELDRLSEKIPSREVLQETGLGLELNKLRKHYDSKVSKIATMIYRSWKSHFKQLKDKPKIEVRTDTDTKKYRSAGRRLVEDILKPHKEATLLAEAVERSIYEMNSNIGNPYKRHMRSVIFMLRHQKELREKFLNKKLSVVELCKLKAKTK